jgi:hypothetical protein
MTDTTAADIKTCPICRQGLRRRPNHHPDTHCLTIHGPGDCCHFGYDIIEDDLEVIIDGYRVRSLNWTIRLHSDIGGIWSATGNMTSTPQPPLDLTDEELIEWAKDQLRRYDQATAMNHRADAIRRGRTPH